MVYDVVTIGSAAVDQFADTDSELIKIKTRTSSEEFIAFPLGSKLLIKNLNVTVGGGGTNSAVCCSRLGLNTAYIGKVGSDGNGDFILQLLRREGVEFIGARGGRTGLSVILDSIEEDRCILAYKGANNCLKIEDIPEFKTRWIYLSSMLEDSLATVLDLLSRVECKLAFNPSNYQAEMGYERLKPLIDYVDLLIMNKEEASVFLGLRHWEHQDTRALIQELAKLPPKIIAITDGRNGASVYDGKHVYMASPIEGLRVVETTGAGDAFASTLMTAIAGGEPMEGALHLAMTNAESVLMYKGAKEMLLPKETLHKEAAQRNRSIEKGLL